MGRGQDDAGPSKPRRGALAALVPAARLLGIGWYFAAVIIVFTGGGWWLGQRFPSLALQVLMTIAGLLAGLGAAAFGGYRMVREALAGTREDGGKPSA